VTNIAEEKKRREMINWSPSPMESVRKRPVLVGGEKRLRPLLRGPGRNEVLHIRGMPKHRATRRGKKRRGQFEQKQKKKKKKQIFLKIYYGRRKRKRLFRIRGEGEKGFN